MVPIPKIVFPLTRPTHFWASQHNSKSSTFLFLPCHILINLCKHLMQEDNEENKQGEGCPWVHLFLVQSSVDYNLEENNIPTLRGL